MDLACPDPLEKIFQQVEEQNELRAQLAEVDDSVPSTIARMDSSDNLRKRRRGSISISRFGQLSPDQTSEASSGGPMTPALSDIAAKSPFFQAQLRSQNGSQTSFASGASGADDTHDEEDHHVTHMQTIAPRQSLSRAVGGLFPRRLSRARSVLPPAGEPSVVIGVSVAAATVEGPGTDAERTPATVVHAPGGVLRSQASRGSMASVPNSPSWAARAKQFTKKFRRKSKIALADAPAAPAAAAS